MIAFVIPSTIQTASIGIPDTFFLMVLALIVFGPRRLPEIGRQIGKLMYEFRKVSNDFKFQMEEELRASEEAARQEKLAASSQMTQTVYEAPPVVLSPVSLDHVTPAEITAGSNIGADDPKEPVLAGEAGNVSEMEWALKEPGPIEPAAIAGEVRGEPGKFPPTIKPPSGGEPVAAARPFRTAEVKTDLAETVTESGALPDAGSSSLGEPVLSNAAVAKVAVDEGRVGTEVQPGVEGVPRISQMTIDSGASVSEPQREAEREARHA